MYRSGVYLHTPLLLIQSKGDSRSNRFVMHIYLFRVIVCTSTLQRILYTVIVRAYIYVAAQGLKKSYDVPACWFDWQLGVRLAAQVSSSAFRLRSVASSPRVALQCDVDLTLTHHNI
ncbi:hypothetical protein TNCV_2858991 [Trichonephila clavipes]|nr:hypothetical protein TNCV_2858991 [Trichonephila clavipes]